MYISDAVFRKGEGEISLHHSTSPCLGSENDYSVVGGDGSYTSIP
jgi:hypothetical protein